VNRAKVCLNMIVKNESHVIQRCLARVRPYIDAWVIVDTGSSDGTQELIRRELAEIPGTLHERPWKDFGHNRSEALELARASGADYAFVIDADEEFEPPPGFAWPELGADAYEMLQTAGNTRFYRVQLMRLAMPWRYEGVLHEVAHCPGANRPDRISGPITHGHFDSARNQNPIEKYRRDAAVLEAALRQEPGNARYVFYLAQSYRDSGQNQKAERSYERRAKMGGWEEEVWYSLFQIGALRERQGRSVNEIVAAYLAAFEQRPRRIEPLVALAAYFRLRGEHGRAFIFAKAARGLPVPGDILFLDHAAYSWRVLDEYAIAAYWVGQYEESLRVTEELLAAGTLPAAHQERVLRNKQFALEKLGRA
jgi:tetratricopeptide (TPR) repeat protein